MLRARLFLLLATICSPSFGDQHTDGMMRIPGYQTAGFVGDVNATRFFSAMSIVASSIQNLSENEILLLLFIGDGVIEKDRIAEFGLQGFSVEQARTLAALEMDQGQCNLLQFDSELAQEVHLLAIDTDIATEAELHRCILVLLAKAQGVSKTRTDILTNQELIVEFIQGL